MSKRIKMKDLLKESHVWERKFGEKLPTLDDIQKKYESKNKMNEAKSGDDLAEMCGYIFDAVNDLSNDIKSHSQGKSNSKIKGMIKQLYKIESDLSNELRDLE